MLRRTVARRFYNGIDPIGKVHPDVLWGNSQTCYRGKGWAGMHKQLPQEGLMLYGGSSLGNCNDRQGALQDPEDPRHPIVRIQLGEGRLGFDGAFHQLVHANFGPINQGSRLLQVLYDNYLEPFSGNRLCTILKHYEKVPNNNPLAVVSSVDYCADSASLIGSVMVCCGCTVLEGTTMRGDTNAVTVSEGAQIMENVCMISDAPTTLHHYQRGEGFNPYQTFEALEGVCRVGCNTMVEPGCVLDSCHLGSFNRIGHNTKIMKGAMTGCLVHIMPGSVVLPDTHMHDGELWGGAPAQKLGKISKFEWKKPYFASTLHRDLVCEQYVEWSRYGDQCVYHQEAMDSLDTLMIDFESHLPEGVKARIRDFVEGREPFQHTIARITQGWTPANRADDKASDHLVPNINVNPTRNHNDDVGEQSSFVGTVLNPGKFVAERRW